MVYLNDSFKGGHTFFPTIDLSIKPEKGKAILFWNIDNNENIPKEALHAGLEVESGEKWIVTVWDHVKDYIM